MVARYVYSSDCKENKVAKAKRKRPTHTPYTAADTKLLKQHSKARTPVSKVAKLMKRSEGSLRQKAKRLGIGLGHQR
jgi:TfoX/Sxy family transcriptional regulator of competence genes